MNLGALHALRVELGNPTLAELPDAIELAPCGLCHEHHLADLLVDVSDYAPVLRGKACEACAHALAEEAHVDERDPCSCSQCGRRRAKADAWGRRA